MRHFPAALWAIRPPMHGMQAWRPTPSVPRAQPSSSSVGSAWLNPGSSCFLSGLHRAAYVSEATGGSLASGCQQETASEAGLQVTSEHLCGGLASVVVHLGKGKVILQVSGKCFSVSGGVWEGAHGGYGQVQLV